jgi:cytochrome c oxidase subunit 3
MDLRSYFLTIIMLLHSSFITVRHPYHLVESSPYALLVSLSLSLLMLSSILCFSGQIFHDVLTYIGLICLVLCISLWCNDIIREGSYQGYHTLRVQSGLTLGFVLFVISEVAVFASVFWAFFHSSLSPSVDIGCIWPPLGVCAINPLEVPLLNTVVLLLSSATLTYAHHALLVLSRCHLLLGSGLTIALSLLFTFLQYYEFSFSSFTISDSIYGSTFFALTGLHGLHILLGTVFLSVAVLRLALYHITDSHYLGYQSSILYWHFVDLIWIFVYTFAYLWSYHNYLPLDFRLHSLTEWLVKLQ